MAMSRSLGGSRFTISPPILNVPAVIGSRPAIIRSAVGFPQPDGPPKTTISPAPYPSSSTAALQDAVRRTCLFPVLSQLAVLLAAGLRAHVLLTAFRGRWILRSLILLPRAAPPPRGLMGRKWTFGPSYSVLDSTIVKTQIP